MEPRRAGRTKPSRPVLITWKQTIATSILLFCCQAASAVPLIFTPTNPPRSGGVLQDGGLTVTINPGNTFFAEPATEFGINLVDGTATITPTLGGTFNLLSIEMSNRGTDATVNFTGSNGNLVSFLVTTPGISVFNFGAAFLGVTSVTYDANGGVSGPFASQGVITADDGAPELDGSTATAPVAACFCLLLCTGYRRNRKFALTPN